LLRLGWFPYRCRIRTLRAGRDISIFTTGLGDLLLRSLLPGLQWIRCLASGRNILVFVARSRLLWLWLVWLFALLRVLLLRILLLRILLLRILLLILRRILVVRRRYAGAGVAQ